jgi:NhaP-type Na+/H+ or K+/H+ antiporter
MVKGVVPFALILTIPQTSPATTSNTAQANIVCVVLITSFVFTLFIPKLQKMLLKKINELRTIDPAHPSLKDSLLAADPDSVLKLKKKNS